jgi:tetratricopeptide (TPR) repeat protein
VNNVLVGLLAAMMATHTLAATSNSIQRTTGISLPVGDRDEPAEQALRKIMANDDAAQEEADRWIKENEVFKEKGVGLPEATLTLKIEQRFDAVRKAYEDFLKLHPDHDRARLAFGSFLNDIGREQAAKEQWEKARESDPKNPAAWNNLANYYGYQGPVTNAFVFYAKAIELDPRQPLYYRNLANILFLFRIDATHFFKINEQEVFDRSLQLYRQALQLDPRNFIYATDLAQTYYAIKPARPDEALAAWNATLTLANDDTERAGVYLHLARWELNSGKFEAARAHLNLITNAMYGDLKQQLLRNLEVKALETTNAPTPSH